MDTLQRSVTTAVRRGEIALSVLCCGGRGTRHIIKVVVVVVVVLVEAWRGRTSEQLDEWDSESISIVLTCSRLADNFIPRDLQPGRGRPVKAKHQIK